MRCPFCNAQDSSVLDSRPAEDGLSIRRRRECKVCKKRFTTYEKYETMPLFVIKKDGNREPFDRQKLEKGILSSCNKRPVPADKIGQMVDDIEMKLSATDKKEIPSSFIGELVMEGLKGLDEVAYIRFASVYRDFKDVSTFVEEVSKILKK